MGNDGGGRSRRKRVLVSSRPRPHDFGALRGQYAPDMDVGAPEKAPSTFALLGDVLRRANADRDLCDSISTLFASCENRLRPHPLNALESTLCARSAVSAKPNCSGFGASGSQRSSEHSVCRLVPLGRRLLPGYPRCGHVCWLRSC